MRQKTRRTNGQSLAVIIADVNRTLRRLVWLLQAQSHAVFERLDGWIRMRLRSILRRRDSRRGRGRGADHHRWPNRFFAAQGLFSLGSPCGAPSVLVAGDSSTGEPDAGDPPSGSEGGGNEPIASPYPYQPCSQRVTHNPPCPRASVLILFRALRLLRYTPDTRT